jgi:hypothetical protein
MSGSLAMDRTIAAISFFLAWSSLAAAEGNECPNFCLRSTDGGITCFPDCGRTTEVPVDQAQQHRLREELQRQAEEARRKLRERENAGSEER